MRKEWERKRTRKTDICGIIMRNILANLDDQTNRSPIIIIIEREREVILKLSRFEVYQLGNLQYPLLLSSNPIVLIHSLSLALFRRFEVINCFDVLLSLSLSHSLTLSVVSGYASESWNLCPVVYDRRVIRDPHHHYYHQLPPTTLLHDKWYRNEKWKILFYVERTMRCINFNDLMRSTRKKKRVFLHNTSVYLS